jgi:hypothetical protein
MTNHSASCLGYICTCDNCYRCEGIIKNLKAENLENWNRAEILRAENARLKADLEIIRDWCDRATHRATEALKGME